MSHTLGNHSLKVDQTAIPVNNNFLLISNINIPEFYLDDTLPQILQRVHQFIIHNYGPDLNIQFQITATYTLINAENNQSRLWTGSFFPAGTDRASITQFRSFGPDFIPFCSRHLQRDHIINTLQWADYSSLWRFETLQSVIINIQALVHPNHHVIRSRQLYMPVGDARRRRRRTHVTFLLP